MAVADSHLLPPLLRLPYEISSQIFAYLLVDETINVNRLDQIRRGCRDPSIMSLLLVHRLITEVCLRLVYERSVFSFGYPAAIKRLTDAIGPINRSLIKHAIVTDIQYEPGGTRAIGNPSLASTSLPGLQSCVLRTVIRRGPKRTLDRRFHRVIHDTKNWSPWKVERVHKMITTPGGSLYNGTIVGKKGIEEVNIYRSDIRLQLSSDEYEVDIRKVVQFMKDERARRSRERYHIRNPTAKWKNPLQKKQFEEGIPEEQEIQIKEEPDT